MLDIKFYGTETPSSQLAKSKIKDYLERASIDFRIQEIVDVNVFIQQNIDSVPSLMVNDQHYFKIEKDEKFNASLRSVIRALMKLENYGRAPKIYVPTDFSETSINAYSYAHHLAKDIHGIILLTHIYLPFVAEVNQEVGFDQNLEEEHLMKLKQLTDVVNKDWLGSFIHEPITEEVFKVGFPSSEIEEISKEPNAMIVMGTTGSNDTFKKLFGSLSLDLVEKVHCPMILVPPRAKYSLSDEMVFCSEKLNDDTIHLLFLGKLALSLNATLKLVHFHTLGSKPYDISNAIQLLENYYPTLSYHIDIEDVEDPLKGLEAIVTNASYKLVVLSRPHKNIFQRLFHKSRTEFAAQHCACPLMILTEKVTHFIGKKEIS